MTSQIRSECLTLFYQLHVSLLARCIHYDVLRLRLVRYNDVRPQYAVTYCFLAWYPANKCQKIKGACSDPQPHPPESMWDEEYTGTWFDTVCTNFKFDPCINFNLEFLKLFKGSIVAFVGIWKNTHSTTIHQQKKSSTPFSRFSPGSIRLLSVFAHSKSYAACSVQ